jgi:hypothetical protein
MEDSTTPERGSDGLQVDRLKRAAGATAQFVARQLEDEVKGILRREVRDGMRIWPDRRTCSG